MSAGSWSWELETVCGRLGGGSSRASQAGGGGGSGGGGGGGGGARPRLPQLDAGVIHQPLLRNSHARFNAGYLTLKEVFTYGGLMTVVNLSLWGVVGGLWWKAMGFF